MDNVGVPLVPQRLGDDEAGVVGAKAVAGELDVRLAVNEGDEIAAKVDAGYVRVRIL